MRKLVFFLSIYVRIVSVHWAVEPYCSLSRVPFNHVVHPPGARGVPVRAGHRYVERGHHLVRASSGKAPFSHGGLACRAGAADSVRVRPSAAETFPGRALLL